MKFTEKDFWVGMISGTSVDAIDAVLVQINQERLQLLHAYAEPFPPDLKKSVMSLMNSGDGEINRMGQLDVQLGELFAQTALNLLHEANVKPQAVAAIGSHGQTIRHQPNFNFPFSLQIADPNIISSRTGIITVADFRRKDMALGGQGAPLVPAFHQKIFSDSNHPRIIINIGGIANATILDKESVLGFDTGPGNALMDQWCYKHQQTPFDKQGMWAASGEVHEALLSNLLADPYFKLPAPKSTGREYFHLPWLEKHLTLFPDLVPMDVQATLVELTVRSIASGIQNYLRPTSQVIVCGGGAHNQFLMKRLEKLLNGIIVLSSDDLGVDVDWIEATAFAWFAYRTLNGQPSNLPSVTGAKEFAILGGIYLA